MDRRPKRGGELRTTHFDNARLAQLGIEVLTLGDLRQRVSAHRLAIPERVDFFMLLLIDRGRGRHVIDFSNARLQQGSLVFVRPGQVQQWHSRDGLEGTLVLVDPAVMNPQGHRLAVQQTLAEQLSDWPSFAVLSVPAHGEIQSQFMALGKECAQFDASELGVALIRNMLTDLLLRVARAHVRASPAVAVRAGMAGTFRMVAREVDAQVRRRPTVQGLAATMGYSISTLNRACLAIEGRSAKQVIDRRVALEAQRLLVHGRDSTGEIGAFLGFSEPTNFLKFFLRRCKLEVAHRFASSFRPSCCARARSSWVRRGGFLRDRSTRLLSGRGGTGEHLSRRRVGGSRLAPARERSAEEHDRCGQAGRHSRQGCRRLTVGPPGRQQFACRGVQVREIGELEERKIDVCVHLDAGMSDLT
jgi:AraC-like DNA-binding protein